MTGPSRPFALPGGGRGRASGACRCFFLLWVGGGGVFCCLLCTKEAKAPLCTEPRSFRKHPHGLTFARLPSSLLGFPAVISPVFRIFRSPTRKRRQRQRANRKVGMAKLTKTLSIRSPVKPYALLQPEAPARDAGNSPDHPLTYLNLMFSQGAQRQNFEGPTIKPKVFKSSEAFPSPKPSLE